MSIRDRDGIIVLGDDDSIVENNIVIKATSTGELEFYRGTSENLDEKIFILKSDGLYIKSPDNTFWKITVDNDGVLSTIEE